MKYKNNRWRIPMINLQLFADGEGDGSGAGDGNEDGAGAGSEIAAMRCHLMIF